MKRQKHRAMPGVPGFRLTLGRAVRLQNRLLSHHQLSISAMVRTRVFMDFAVEDEPYGRYTHSLVGKPI